jgi:pimeloyl-ACP methyl ester carboxylesterase
MFRSVKPSDLRGASRLATDATLGLANLVENLHHNILRVPGVLGTQTLAPTRGVTGLVYRSIRGVTRLVGGSVDALLGQVQRLMGTDSDPGSVSSSAEREAVVAALNGVLGDHLVATSNPLAIPMRLRSRAQVLVLDKPGLAAALPAATDRILVLVHGLCMNDRQWQRKGHDHGAALAAGAGFTPVYLHYNSGLHISQNGAELARLLETVLQSWPVPVAQFAIVGHSMGGLVARSACHHAEAAGLAWRRQLNQLVFLGTPHHGAPLERGGHWLETSLGASPYTAAYARLGQVRSAGITDLRHGNLLESDWSSSGRFSRGKDRRSAVPLPQGVACYAVAATLAPEPGGGLKGLRGHLLGDGLVPVASALGQHRLVARRLAFKPEQQWLGHGMNHLGLLDSADVAARLNQWLAAPQPARNSR